MEMGKQRFITVQEVARRLCCQDNYVYQLIQDGKLQAVRIGERALRIAEDSFERFIQQGIIDPADYVAPVDQGRSTTTCLAQPEPHIARSQWMHKKRTISID